ncbi:MAG: transposase [Patescibacteria group bacterium]
MAIRRIPFLVGEHYHLYNRGVDKRIIFVDENDYKRFTALLYLCNSTNPVDMRVLFNKGLSFVEVFSVDRREQIVDIGAYCLMPNHFHILVRERIEKGISIFMEKLSTAYSMYFNKRNNRTGRLSEGPFKAKHIDNEHYFNWLFSYIHLNPVKLTDSTWKENGISDPEKARNFMEHYKYSSYFDYFLGNRSEGVILSKKVFPEHFSQMNDFENLVNELTKGYPL